MSDDPRPKKAKLTCGVIFFVILGLIVLCILGGVLGCTTQPGEGGPDEIDQMIAARLPQEDTVSDTTQEDTTFQNATRATVDSMITDLDNTVFDMNTDLAFFIPKNAAAKLDELDSLRAIELIDSVLADWEARGLIPPEKEE